MAPKILCVAEKPAIAKSVAQHLAGGNVNTVGGTIVCMAMVSSSILEKYYRQPIC